MRIDHLLVTRPVAARTVWAEIDREARKGAPARPAARTGSASKGDLKPIPSDHAPLLFDLDVPGRPIDPGWAGADERIAARRGPRGRAG